MNLKKLMTVGPAVVMTLVSLVLTLAVIVMWLGEVMPVGVAVVVGLGIDGGWLCTLGYERRLAKQGDHSRVVTGVGWGFGLVATGVLAAHALTGPDPAAWLAVAWLPVGAKALWIIHGLWEATALTPDALSEIAELRQTSRDMGAVARARLRAEADAEKLRLDVVTRAASGVTEAQVKASQRLKEAWGSLEGVRSSKTGAVALTSVTRVVAPASRPAWELPVWGSFEELAAIEPPAEESVPPVLADADLDRIVTEIRDSETPPLSYREMAIQFRAAGHSAGETRLRASWKRVSDAKGVAR